MFTFPLTMFGGVGDSIFTPLVYDGVSPALSVTGAGFSPDLVWIKKRTSTNPHVLTDTTRGVNSQLASHSSAPETTNSSSITSFDADGFTLGSSSSVNGDEDSHVAWCFKKDEEAFDIVGYTGTSTARTVDHNMTVAPEMMIVKDLGDSQDWAVYHTALNGGTDPEDYYLRLNTADHEQNNSTIWNDTAPTDTQFTVGTGSQVNFSSRDYIAYLFASKAGVSKVGSYSGTGVSGNAITGLGFSPKFILIKARGTAAGGQSWGVYDTARGGSNQIEANTFDAEITTGQDISFDSDGFTLENTNPTTNFNTEQYIYLALA